MNKKKTQEDTRVGFGVTSLVTSLIGLFGFIAPYISIFFSITAIVFSVLQQKRYKTGLATAGLVLGIIGIVSNVFWLFVLVLVLAFGGA